MCCSIPRGEREKCCCCRHCCDCCSRSLPCRVRPATPRMWPTFLQTQQHNAADPPHAVAAAVVAAALPALSARLLMWRRSDAATSKEIADMIRVGSKSGMRVGPAAATQLLELLRSDNPDLKVKGDDKEDAQGKKKKKG